MNSRDSLIKGMSGSGLSMTNNNAQHKRSGLRNAIVYKRESRVMNKVGEPIVAVKEKSSASPRAPFLPGSHMLA